MVFYYDLSKLTGHELLELYYTAIEEVGKRGLLKVRIKFNGKTPYFASMLVIFNGIE